MNNLVFNAEEVVGSRHPTFIIAEVGQNHQGDFEIAKNLIKKAKVNYVNCKHSRICSH